ncbi:HP0495 family protein [Mangrovitalea sediminis]|uniref:HP0495 family protein n=1 Tax=Mangrovitalea sediminis TaxID=1982043 RepID=UPI000BE4C039|nr:DUF493 domain-containing protein [Mangrovitalea sediminis]
MSEPTPPKIEFPCDYGIKVIGDAAPDFKQFVMEVVSRHDPELVEERVSINASRNGRFFSVRLTIVATGEPQLKALFEELKASGRVHMVL